MGYATPEDAARGDTPTRYVQVVDVVVRGNQAVVAQLMNDGPPFEIDTAVCHRAEDGTWDEGQSGNSNAAFLPSGEGIGTYVGFYEAPAGAVSARFYCHGREQTVDVKHGGAVAAFDDVPEPEPFSFPQVVAWIYRDGREEAVERFDPPNWVRERMKKRRQQLAEEIESGGGVTGINSIFETFAREESEDEQNEESQ